MSQPAVTALIDTYNHSRFIEEAIESVLAQDYTGPMEIVVVDDGSTDDTAARVKKYGERVRYIWKENGGQASALNRGFAEARGEIVAMLDGDDVWAVEKVRRVVEEFKNHAEAGMVYHPYQNWDMVRGRSEDEPGFYPISGRVPESVSDLLRYGNFGTCGMALRREAVAQILPIPEALRIYADTYLVYLIIFVAPVAGIPTALTRYRHHGENLAAFGAQDARRMRQRFQCYQTALQEIRAALVRRGYDVTRPDLAAFLKRHELVAEMFQFRAEAPGRRAFYQHLKSFHELYGPLWTTRYRAFRSLVALLGAALGYRAYEAARDFYRESRSLLDFREWAFRAREEAPETPLSPGKERQAAAR